MAISVTDNLALIHRLLKRYGSNSVWLEVVSNVQTWCKLHGVPEDNPFRAAKCFAADGRYLIVMRELQTDSMIRSAKQLMELNGFESEVEALTDDTQYLTHLVLHELAMVTLGTTDQDSRDAWAFHQMQLCK